MLLSYDQTKPWAKYFRPSMQPLRPHVVDALARGPRPLELFDGDLTSAGYLPVETGYTVVNGGMIVAVLTDMPGLSALDWHYWFAWHGDDSSKYCLWHPLAHQSVRWEKPGTGYIGRTSLVTEYLGSESQKLAISFIEPSSMGLDADSICAKVRLQGMPFDAGTLVHQLRATPNGCEMRSRFRVGGDFVDSRLGSFVSKWTSPMKEEDARALLVHCAEEMNHLAGFLKELRTEFGP